MNALSNSVVESVAQVTIVTARRSVSSNRARKADIARNALLAAVLLFVLIQGLIALLLQTEIVRLRDPIYFEKLELLERHIEFFQPAPSPSKERVLAIGSSRIMLGFDAKRFTETAEVSAVNFGIPAAGTLTSTLYLRRLLVARVQIDHLFFEIHPGFIAEPRKGEPPFEARWLHPYRLRQSEVLQLHRYGYWIPRPAHLTALGWMNSAQAFQFPLLDAVAPRWLPCPYGLRSGDRLDERGWGPGVEPPEHLRPWALAMAKQEYAPVLDNYRVGGPGVAAIEDVTVLCQHRGIPLTLVVPPEAAVFRSWYGHEGLHQLDEYVQQWRERGQDVVDARSWVPDEMFADGHHLTRAGARLFVDRLAQVWRRPR